MKMSLHEEFYCFLFINFLSLLAWHVQTRNYRENGGSSPLSFFQN